MKKKIRTFATSLMAVALAFSIGEPYSIKAENIAAQIPAASSADIIRKEFNHTCYDSNGIAILTYSIKPEFFFNGEFVSIVNSPTDLIVYEYDKTIEAVTLKEPNGSAVTSITYRIGYQYSDSEQHFESITYSCDKFGNLSEKWKAET